MEKGRDEANKRTVFRDALNWLDKRQGFVGAPAFVRLTTICQIIWLCRPGNLLAGIQSKSKK